MTDDISLEDAQKLLAGEKRTVKINAIWDFKKDYCGSVALLTRSAGYNKVAMPHIQGLDSDSEEYRCALSIIKQVSAYHKGHVQLEEGKTYRVYGYHTDGATYTIDKIYGDIIYFKAYGLKANISDLRFENIEVTI